MPPPPPRRVVEASPTDTLEMLPPPPRGAVEASDGWADASLDDDETAPFVADGGYDSGDETVAFPSSLELDWGGKLEFASTANSFVSALIQPSSRLPAPWTYTYTSTCHPSRRKLISRADTITTALCRRRDKPHRRKASEYYGITRRESGGKLEFSAPRDLASTASS